MHTSSKFEVAGDFLQWTTTVRARTPRRDGSSLYSPSSSINSLTFINVFQFRRENTTTEHEYPPNDYKKKIEKNSGQTERAKTMRADNNDETDDEPAMDAEWNLQCNRGAIKMIAL